MKTFKTLIALAGILLAGSAHSQNIRTDFGDRKAAPHRSVIVIQGVDCETTQTIDIQLPDGSVGHRYRLEEVVATIDTAPSAVTTKGKVSIESWDGTTATQIRGAVDLEAPLKGTSDTLFSSRGSGGGYVYYQDVVAAGTTGLCTKNVTLDTPGALAGVVSPDVPRRIVITTVDNAGDDLAGTVTLVGLNVEGEEITEVVTIAAGVDTHTSTNVFATLTAGTHDFGATATVTVDELDLGQDAMIGLPSRNAVPVLVISTGTVETITTKDPAQGAITFVDAPDGASDYEVWYRTFGQPVTIDGGDFLRLQVTGSTVTGDDIRDIVVYLLKF